MANQWYFARDGETAGPFSAAQLQKLAASGQIRRQDTVWVAGTDRRVSAAKVKGLFAVAPAPVPPAAPAAPPAPSRRRSPQPATLAVESSPPPAATAAAPATLAERLAAGEDLELAPGTKLWEDAAPAEPDDPAAEQPREAKQPSPPQAEARNKRVLAVKGGVLSAQDGKVVRYRKQCLRCGYLDTSMTTMPIRAGVTRVNFFCPKCRKSQQTEVTGVG
jgi:hypothetical protein